MYCCNGKPQEVVELELEITQAYKDEHQAGIEFCDCNWRDEWRLFDSAQDVVEGIPEIIILENDKLVWAEPFLLGR